MKDWIIRKIQETRGPAKIIPFPLKDENIERLRQARADKLDGNIEIEGHRRYDEYIETS
jgi:hypothetical protein|tara:strand:+ start:3264 stop:3440 length:177 start_codon:yes stop_codon:yes gene_type:complete